MTDPVSPTSRQRPDWAALARLASGEPPADAAAHAGDGAARAWLDAHAGDAALVRAVGAMRPETFAASAPAVDVEAALARVRHAAGLAGVASPTLTLERGGAATTARATPVRRPPVGRTPIGRIPVWRRAGALLAASVAVAAGVVVARGAARPPATEPALAQATTAPARHATGVGERQAFRLADGTQVVLGPASTLDVPAGYAVTARRVRLSGEAYFRAVHDPRRPFEVAAGDAVVQDVGTAFVVRGAPQRAVDVAVTDGSVRLRAAGRPGAAADTSADASADAAGDRARPATGVLLRAGDRGRVLASVGAATATVSVVARGTDVAADTAWTSGRLVFRDTPLGDVAGALRRWYGVTLRFADPALTDRHLTATFAGDSADEVLRVIGLATGARLERHGDTVVVRGAAAGAAAGAAPAP